MSEKFIVVDKRGEKGEVIGQSLPVSMLEDVIEVKLKPGQNFVHPSRGRVLIQEDVALNAVGRIIIPDKVKKRPTTGLILEVGADVVDYQAGQKIVFGLYSGTVLTYKGWDPKTRINFRMLSVEEILGTQDDEAPELEGVGT